MDVHLVTYATPLFRVRQWILGGSARLNKVVDTVTFWNPSKLISAGFYDICKDIKLTERGSGFWSWKPFIILQKLKEVPDGDLVFYCDVGRSYPIKEINLSITPLITWMESKKQDFIPGVLIPWTGSAAVWTKRDAFVNTGMDSEVFHRATPVQASFSIWRSSQSSRDFVTEWLSLACCRDLISDDPSKCGMNELPEFKDHRHDQALLTLCCIKRNAQAIDLGTIKPQIDTKDPSEVTSLISGVLPENNFFGKKFSLFIRFVSYTEYILNVILLSKIRSLKSNFSKR